MLLGRVGGSNSPPRAFKVMGYGSGRNPFFLRRHLGWQMKV